MTDFPDSTVLGYPRIGRHRELKRALEAYWDGRAGIDDLHATGARLRAETCRRLADRLQGYRHLLADLAAAGAAWVQLDEPALVMDRSATELEAVRTAYETLSGQGPALFVATYFGDPGAALPVLAGTPVEAIGLDLVRGSVPEEAGGKTIVAG